MYKPINGWTKTKILRRIRDKFTVKSEVDTGLNGPKDKKCLYRGTFKNVKTMCGFGLFIPDNVYSTEMEDKNAMTVLDEHPILKKKVPFSKMGMQRFQDAHDDSQNNTKEELIQWVERNVKDAKTK